MDEKRFNKLVKYIKVNQNAFTQLYKYYFPKIVIHTVRKFRNYTLGEDAAQEFFRKLLEMDTIPQKIEKPTAWVYTVSDNITKNLLTKRKRETLVPPDVAQNLSENSLEQEIASFEQLVFGEYSEKLRQLNTDTREIIVKHLWEGYSLKEIAESMNLNYDAVKQKYSRGLKKLKKMK